MSSFSDGTSEPKAIGSVGVGNKEVQPYEASRTFFEDLRNHVVDSKDGSRSDPLGFIAAVLCLVVLVLCCVGFAARYLVHRRSRIAPIDSQASLSKTCAGNPRTQIDIIKTPECLPFGSVW
eukprot:3455712-Amphidinium_carterae.1